MCRKIRRIEQYIIITGKNCQHLFLRFLTEKANLRRKQFALVSPLGDKVNSLCRLSPETTPSRLEILPLWGKTPARFRGHPLLWSVAEQGSREAGFLQKGEYYFLQLFSS